MGYQKNDLVTVRIEDMGQNGEGIGKADGYTLFVKDTVIGDSGRGEDCQGKKKLRVWQADEDCGAFRETAWYPVCPIARQCGGCQLQMLDYGEQLRFKEDKVRNDLMRIGGFEDVPMEPIIGMEQPFRYRNKAQFPGGMRQRRKSSGRILCRAYPYDHPLQGLRAGSRGEPERFWPGFWAGWRKISIPAYDEMSGRRAGAACADPVWIYDR